MKTRTIRAVLALSLLTAAANAAVTLNAPTLTAKADLGTATFSLSLPTKAGSDGGNAQTQIFLRNDTTNQFVMVAPPPGTVANVYPDGGGGSLTFSAPLPVGHYSTGKVDLFVDGSNYASLMAEFPVADQHLDITTMQTRVTAPTLTLDGATAPGADAQLHIAYTVKEPKASAQNLWIMVKGNSVFSQAYIAQSALKPGGDPLDDYLTAKGEFVVPMPSTPGVYSPDSGIFTGNWALLTWKSAAVSLEVNRPDGSSWVTMAPASAYPSLSQIMSAPPIPPAPGIIGANFGNAAVWGNPDNNSPTYFKLLKAKLKGLAFVRVNFGADEYLTPIGRHKIQQIKENILAAGLVPLMNPQDMPTGGVPSLVKIAQQMAADSAGEPVVIGVLNEPHGYGTWASWKPDAQKVVDAIRAINPAQVIVVDAEGYSKDLNAESADPIAGTILGWHPYLDPKDLKAAAGRVGTPILVEEYHPGLDASTFDAALAAIPNIKGVAAWAWTTPGQDSLPLVKGVNGALMTLTPDGDALAADYAVWATGAKVVPPAPVVPVVPVTPPPPGDFSAAQQAQIKAIADAEFRAILKAALGL